MSACIDKIKQWMTLNYLKFNEEKNEFLVAIAKHLKHHLPPVSLRVGTKFISPSDSVRNIGIVFDSSMSMTPQITSLCTNLNYQLRNISRIRKFLDDETCHYVIRTLVLSRIDYGNALLCGSNQKDLKRLQRIQNWAAKLIYYALKKDHATPYLRELHWLPVKKRITFKIMVYAYKCIHGLAPPYLSSLLRLYHPARSGLRSASDSSRLYEHNTKHLLTTSSNQTFSIVVPQVWNSIDISIRNSPSLVTFKKSLKTMLFPF